ncbi:GNAT family N-acetyltransferase [Gymnodinialimonas sp. 2305UL16-5]|uniref:GNAT family N-acetyltransferase n=1 Tax=Gymnodinialimonas mytili TaxID=3126503 RepID=UPI0030B0D70D
MKPADKAAIRRASAADLPAILALVEAAYRPWVAKIGVEPGPLFDDYAGAIATDQITLVEGALGVEAILVLVPQSDAMLLDNVAVLPAAQGRGHGGRLIKLAENRARDAGFDRLRLYTHAHMTSNIALYRKLGFAQTRRVTERGLDRIYMEKPLGQRDT